MVRKIERERGRVRSYRGMVIKIDEYIYVFSARWIMIERERLWVGKIRWGYGDRGLLEEVIVSQREAVRWDFKGLHRREQERGVIMGRWRSI